VSSLTDKWIKGFLEQNLFEAAPLTEYFRAESHGDKWHMFCNKCGRAWSLKKQAKGTDYHPGNLLHLLNHARSHK
jgi:hypothetical protein